MRINEMCCDGGLRYFGALRRFRIPHAVNRVSYRSNRRVGSSLHIVDSFVMRSRCTVTLEHRSMMRCW